jgi:hypothetical protein
MSFFRTFFGTNFGSDRFKEITKKWPVGKIARLRINQERVMIVGYTEAWSIEVRRENLDVLLVREPELEEAD